MINHAEGIASIDQEQLQLPGTYYREITKGQSLRTGEGWAEIQLGPNAYLWMGENGTLRMEDSTLTNMQLSVERGSIVVEVYNPTGGNIITIHFGEARIKLGHAGLFRLDSGESQFSVFAGKAQIEQAGNKATIKQGKVAILRGGLSIAKFNRKQMDQLQRIAMQRSSLVRPYVPAPQQARQTWPSTQGQVMSEQQKRLAEEERQRQQETWRQENNRPYDAQEGHQQPPWAVPR